MALDILGYVTGYAGSLAKKIMEKATSKELPETVRESGGDVHPVTKGYMSRHNSHKTYVQDTGRYHVKGHPYSGFMALVLPVVISTILWIFLKFNTKNYQSQGYLSPPGRNILINLLLVFSILYALFLILAYIGNLQASKKGKIFTSK